MDDLKSPQPEPPAPDAGAVTRRQFVTTAATAAAGFMIVPRHVLGRGMQAPSDLVNIAIVGINGQGASNAQAVMSQNIVAICDVDDKLLDAKLKSWRDQVYPTTPPATPRPPTPPPPSKFTNFGLSKAQQAANANFPQQVAATNRKRFVDEQMDRVKKYRDYREMLEKQKDIDAVIVATPDHMHAVITSAAMDAGKHVYTQKPLCWCVSEARHLAKKAAQYPKLVTQMGNQGHSGDDARRGQEYLASGVLGDVRDVHVWTNRPLGYWPQGVPRPTPFTGDPTKLAWNQGGLNTRLASAMNQYTVPDTLAWDLFLGVAPHVEYHPVYHPFNWRGWVDWGQGALGDMGAHLIDHPVWGLELGLPLSVETIATPFNDVSYPNATTTYYEFASRKGKPPVRLVWYDGGLTPPRPDDLGDEIVDPSGAILYVGNKGRMIQEVYGNKPRLLPSEKHNSYGPPKERLPRIAYSGHEMNWVNTIRGRDQISSPFPYAAHLVEIMLLGVVSLRARQKIFYDGEAMRITNTGPKGADLNHLLTREYRGGYSLG